MPANLENSAVATGMKRSVFIPIPKKGNDKECSNYCAIAIISHASRLMLKIFQARILECHSPKSSHPLPLPQSPKDCSIHLCPFCCHIRNKSPVQVRCRIQDAWGWCTGMTQRDGMGREEGGGFRMGNTCIPVADSF